MSKITNDGLTRSGSTGCFIVSCTCMATVGVKGLTYRCNIDCVGRRVIRLRYLAFLWILVTRVRLAMRYIHLHRDSVCITSRQSYWQRRQWARRSYRDSSFTARCDGLCDIAAFLCRVSAKLRSISTDVTCWWSLPLPQQPPRHHQHRDQMLRPSVKLQTDINTAKNLDNATHWE